MIELNLLPAKVRAAETLRLIIIVACFFYAAAALALGYLWSQGHMQLVAAERETARVQAELDAPDLQDAVKAVQHFSDDMASVKAKASVVNQFRKDQGTLVRLLDTLPDWTQNGQVWFSTVESKGEKGHKMVSLVGNTTSRALFAKFYGFMESQALVKNLALDAPPAPTTVHNSQVLQFRLSFSIEDYQ